MIAAPVKDVVADAPAQRPGALGAIAGDDFDRNVWCVLGLPVDIATIAAAAIAVEAAARDGRRLGFVTPNVNWLVRAAFDREARRQILDADLSLADGAPLVVLARLLGAPLKERAAGADLFEALRRRPGFRGRRIRVFFFGGREGSAKAAFERLSGERGGLEAAGWLNPGHGDVDSMSGTETIAAINAAEPDFVVVALGAAKGQAWIDRNKDRLTAPVIAHLGAVVDFTSGAIVRAPRFLSRMGLEWAFRIAAEPALASRYFKDGVALARLVVSQLAPQLLIGRKSAGRALSATVEARAAGHVVRIRGDASAADLAPVRAAFRSVAGEGRGVTLDLSQAGGLDRAFLGQVLMLEKHLTRRGAELAIAGASRSVERLFRLNQMAYLTREPQADEAQAPAAAAI